MGCGNGEMQASYAGKEPPVRLPWLSAVANLTRPSVVLFPAMLGKSSFHFQTRSSQGYEFNFTYGV